MESSFAGLSQISELLGFPDMTDWAVYPVRGDGNCGIYVLQAMLVTMGQLNTPGLPSHAARLADPYQSVINARKGLQFLFLAVIHDQ